MNMDWFILLFGLVAFLLGSIGWLACYAAAAAQEAEHEHGPLARLTLRICRALGIAEESDSEKGQRPEGPPSSPHPRA